MKIRFGQVSNSSTSSFFGIGFSTDEIKVREKYLTPEIKKFIEDNNQYELAEALTCSYGDDPNEASKLLKEVEYASPDDCSMYFYVDLYSMKDDETKREFIDRVKSILTEVFDISDKSIGYVSEAWRDG